MFTDFFNAFIVFLAVMDPFASLPAFLAVTRRVSKAKKIESANIAVLAAAIPFAVFLFFGAPVLEILRVSVDSFEIASGIVLILMGLQLVLGFKLTTEHGKSIRAAAVIIGVPLITGPGVITTSIIMVYQYGYFLPFAAGLLALLVTWAMLRAANLVKRVLGGLGIEIFSRMMGFLIVAIGVEFIRKGLGLG